MRARVETGTFKGGTSMLAALLAREAANPASGCPQMHRNIWLADSFEGLPAGRKEDEGKDAGGLTMGKKGSYGGYAYGGMVSVRSSLIGEIAPSFPASGEQSPAHTHESLAGEARSDAGESRRRWRPPTPRRA